MKHFYVIECDTELSCAFVREVRQEFRAESVNYHHKPCAEMLVCDAPGPKFYGHLDALLVTRSKIENAAPITPELESAIR